MWARQASVPLACGTVRGEHVVTRIIHSFWQLKQIDRRLTAALYADQSNWRIRNMIKNL
jgi:hypothetical protein